MSSFIYRKNLINEKAREFNRTNQKDRPYVSKGYFLRFHKPQTLSIFLSGKYSSREPTTTFVTDVDYELSKIDENEYDQDKLKKMTENMKIYAYLNSVGYNIKNVRKIMRGSRKELQVTLVGVYAYQIDEKDAKEGITEMNFEGYSGVREHDWNDCMIVFEGIKQFYNSIDRECVVKPIHINYIISHDNKLLFSDGSF